MRLVAITEYKSNVTSAEFGDNQIGIFFIKLIKLSTGQIMTVSPATTNNMLPVNPLNITLYC